MSREALFRGILDNPEDDVPRLVFADWLEEHGEADRAEFIRVQCERARSGLIDCQPIRCGAVVTLRGPAGSFPPPSRKMRCGAVGFPRSPVLVGGRFCRGNRLARWT